MIAHRQGRLGLPEKQGALGEPVQPGEIHIHEPDPPLRELIVDQVVLPAAVPGLDVEKGIDGGGELREALRGLLRRKDSRISWNRVRSWVKVALTKNRKRERAFVKRAIQKKKRVGPNRRVGPS